MTGVQTCALPIYQKEQEKVKNAAETFWNKKPDYKHNPFRPSAKNRWERALEKLQERKELFVKANEILLDPKKTSIFLVMIPQILPLEETKRAVVSLEKFNINCAGIFINQIIPKNQVDEFWQVQTQKQDEILTRVNDELKGQNKYYIWLSSLDLRGYEKLSQIEFKE